MSEKIVTCFLMGGLGNQLFQIFVTMAYSIRYNRKMVLPYSRELGTGITRPTYWDSLLSTLKKFTTANGENNCTNEQLFHLPMFKESSHNYSEIPEINNDFLQFYGYFQSFKYFEKEWNEILSSIDFNSQQNQIKNEYMYHFHGNSNSISMHFRLGDYKEKQDCHPIMPYTYYEYALMYIIVKLNLSRPVFVFCFYEKDDSDLVKEKIDKLQSKFSAIKFIIVDHGIEDWKQMLIMSCCDHNIIANSSFSWWGAYFNQNKEKIVCYPKLWFGPLIPYDVSDMFPSEWNKIEW